MRSGASPLPFYILHSTFYICSHREPQTFSLHYPLSCYNKAMMIQFFKNKVKPIHITIVAVLSLLMLGVMDIYSLPAIAKAAGGIPAFDLQTFGYSHESALQFIGALSESGKSLFLHFQLPLDFCFAFVYTFLFLSLFIKLHPVGSKLCFLPILLFIADIIENTLSICFLKLNTISVGLTAFGSAVTLCKNLLTLICAVTIIVFLILYLIKRKKRK